MPLGGARGRHPCTVDTFLVVFVFLKKICFVYIVCYEEFELNKITKIKKKKKKKKKKKILHINKWTSGQRFSVLQRFSCKSALNLPVVCSTDRSKAVVPVLVLLFVALWFILRGDLLYVFPCVILFLCFSVLLVLRLPRLGKRELILVFFVRLFGLCLFRFVGFLFLLGSGKGCGL